MADRFKAARSRVRRLAERAFLGERAVRHGQVGRAVDWKKKRAFQIDFLRSRGLAPSDRVLDLGCGTLRGGVPVIEYLEPGHYWGIDVRAEALSGGMRELLDAGLEDRTPSLLLTPSLADLRLSERFEVAWAYSVLFHMTDAIARDALGFVAAHLADGGAFYANVNLGEQPDGAWDRFPVRWRTRDTYDAWAREVGLEIEDLGPIGALGHDFGDAREREQPMLRFHRP